MTISERLYILVFKTDIKAGKQFDVLLLWNILLRLMVMMVQFIPEIKRCTQLAFVTMVRPLTLIFIAYFSGNFLSPIALK